MQRHLSLMTLLIFLITSPAQSRNNFEDIVGQAITGNLIAVPGQYIVKLKSPSFTLNFHSINLLMTATPLKLVNENFYLVSFFAQPTKDTILKIKENPNVDYIEPNYIYNTQPLNKLDDAQNPSSVIAHQSINIEDPLYKEQWAFPFLGVPKVWKKHKGSKEIIVAIIDSGIFYDHTDLKDNIWENLAEKNGIEGVDDDGNGYIDDIRGWDFAYEDNDPKDGNGHGSHCAGTIGALHNDKGVRGINGLVKLMAIQFGYANGGSTLANAIQAIDYAVNNGARIISNSWGGLGNSVALKEAIMRAGKKGILFVAAAGNKGRNIDQEKFYPASYDLDNVFTVGSIDPNGKKSSFSNWGKKSVDLFAPGRNILSTVNKTNWRPKWYRHVSGTSMAAPFVSGAAALYLSKHPHADHFELTEQLKKSASSSAKLKSFSKWGLLNIDELMKN